HEHEPRARPLVIARRDGQEGAAGDWPARSGGGGGGERPHGLGIRTQLSRTCRVRTTGQSGGQDSQALGNREDHSLTVAAPIGTVVAPKGTVVVSIRSHSYRRTRTGSNAAALRAGM